MVNSSAKAVEARRFLARKKPQQERSRVTVDSIMQATTELIAKDGFQSLTTTRIAERAGISVGSLYEYFPNREAILLRLYESTSAHMANVARKIIVEILELPITEGIPRSIAALQKAYSENKLILLDMVTALPELNLTNYPISYNNLMRGSVGVYLQHVGVEMSKKELERRLFFIRQILIGCIREYLERPPAGMSRREFVADLSKIIIPYIREVASPNDEAAS